MWKYLWLGVCLTGTSLLPALADEPAPMRTVDHVDLDRYVGTWYEIARLPNRFQKMCVGDVTAEYSLRDDGRIDVVNRCVNKSGETKSAKGIARVVDETSRAKLEVRFAPAILSFLPMVWGDYWILDLAPDYSHVVVGEPSRKYLWVLARKRALPVATYEEILALIRSQGYEPAKLIETVQAP